MEYRRLGKTDLQVSVLSFGGSSLGGVFRAVEEAEAIRTVHTAADLGINFIDTSPFYGITRAEAVLGKALREVSRDRFYIATKAGRYGEAEFDFSARRVTASLNESLTRLGLDYVDLIQCHDIEYGSLDQVVQETLPALRRLQASGKARFVGITALPLSAFRYVTARADVDTILSYCHYSLNDTALDSLIPELAAKDTGIISASPLSMGLLTNRGAPAWHPAPEEIRETCRRAAAHCRAKGVDIAQLALQFSLSNPRIHTTLVGTASPENLRKNVAWLAGPMDTELLAEVQSILQPVHDRTWQTGRVENNYRPV